MFHVSMSSAGDKICSNSFVTIMFNEYSAYHISKVRFWGFFAAKTG